MRILIYGAGVLGSNLAHLLLDKHDVTILARNKTYENLKNNGLIIKHILGKKTIDKINVINELKSDNKYDAIFVVARNTQLDGIVSILENNVSNNIIFIGNNITAEKYNLKDKNVLFGFFSAAGKKYGTYIKSICLKKITIGRIDGLNKSDEFIHSIFEDTKIKLIIENKMNDYLKSHACCVLPLVFACYKCDGDLKKIKNDKEYSLQIIDAIIEGYEVLRKIGYEILPKGDYEDYINKKSFCAFLYRFMFSNFIGQIALSDHAMSARDEFELLDNEFLKLKDKSGLNTPTYDKLRKSFIND